MDQLGHSQIIPYILGIKDKVSDLYVISFEKKNNKLNKNEIFNTLQKKKINWKPLNFTNKFFFIIKIFDILKIIYFPFLLSVINKINIVHCRGHIPAIAGLLLKKIFKIKFIFDCRGFWADERFDDGNWNKKKIFYILIYKFFKTLERSFFKNSDHIVVLTNVAKEILIKNYSINEDRISVIPCCADYSKFKINSTNIKSDMKKNMGFDDTHIILGYIGTLSNLYMVKEMIYFFKKLHNNNSNFRFLIVTKDKNKINSLINTDDKFLLENNLISFKDADGGNISDYINLFDISLCFVLSSNARKASSPTKVGESLACGVPVICNKNVGDLNDWIPKLYNHGLLDCSNFSMLDKVANNISYYLSLDKHIIRSKSKLYMDQNNALFTYHKIYGLLI